MLDFLAKYFRFPVAFVLSFVVSAVFFLAIPVMFGASLLKILKYDGSVSGHEIGLLLVGMVTAFGVSLLVINRLMAFIRKHSFTVFGWYRIALGVIVLILGAAGVIGGGVLQGAA
jgi:undecaprenyl-diphosphatase